jgi:ATP-dependent Clp protease protease subunit
MTTGTSNRARQTAQTPNAEPPVDAFAMFCGFIDQDAVARLLALLTKLSRDRARRLHLLFQSNGGNVGDGVCLYNAFRTAPLEVVLYNVGAVRSSAALAYLGATRREASRHSLFMLHRCFMSATVASVQRLQALADGLAYEDQRARAILQSHLGLSDIQWRTIETQDLVLTAAEAVQIGLASGISEFAPPPQARLYAI